MAQSLPERQALRASQAVRRLARDIRRLPAAGQPGDARSFADEIGRELELDFARAGVLI